jgi:hypothetical protein
MEHQGFVYAAAFSPDGTRVVTVSDDGATIWDVDVQLAASEPALLASAAEGIARASVNERGAIVPLADAALRMQQLRRDTAAAGPSSSGRSFLRWLLDDPWSRTVSPQSMVTVSDYVREQLARCNPKVRARLEEAFRGHPLLQRADGLCAGR